MFHSIVLRSAITNDALLLLFPSRRHFILLFLILCICWIEDTKSTAAAATTRESSSFVDNTDDESLFLLSASSPRLFPAAASEQYSLASTVWRTVDPTNFSFDYHQQQPHDDIQTSASLYPTRIVELLQAAKDRFLQSLLMEDDDGSSISSIEEEEDDENVEKDYGTRDSSTFSFSASTSTSSTTTKSLLSNTNFSNRNYNINKNSSDNNITIVPLTCLWIEIGDSSIIDAEHGVDESYQLQVKDHHHHHDDETDHDTNQSCFSDSSGARLSATTIFGILHGLTSFRQLLLRPPLSSTTTTRHHGHHPHHHGHHHQDYFVLRYTPLLITDAPRFPHRGLLIDTSRHYLSVSLILDTITAMAWNKLNVLHWHITDSQSWPLVLDDVPEVSQHGAYCKACVYTPHDVAHIRRHAWYHGIRVIPEVDVPGHIQSLGKSHPEWLSPCGYADGTDTAAAVAASSAAGGGERRSEPLDPTNEQVYQVFLPQLYHDLSTRLFPNTSMIHIGGDEVSLTCWNTSPTIQAWMKRHNMTEALDLWKLFERRLIQDILPQVPSFTTVIVWQEVFNEGLVSNYSHSQQENHSSNNIKSTTTTTNVPQLVVDVWKGLDVTTIQQALQEDFAVIVSGCWYLDHLDQDWANMYKCNILSALNNTSSASSSSKLLWGGHASMWGERVDETDFASRVWPRASAVAERLWSGYYNDTTTANNKNDISNSNLNNRSNGVNFEASVEDRLDAFRCFLLSQGIAASPIRPGYCARGHRGAFAVKHKLSRLAQT